VDPALTDYRGYAGHVASGSVAVGDEVVVSSSGLRTTVVGIDRGGESVDRAVAPLSVTLRLQDALDVSRGDLIAGADAAPASVRHTDAVLCWLAEQPLVPGARVLVKHGTRTVRAIVPVIDSRLDIATLAVQPADRAGLNDLVRVGITLAEPLPLEPYAVSRSGGSFLVVDPQDGTTLAAGMVGAELRAGEGP
jgi:sulfate adenylyltransferase subunit 1